MGGGLMQLVAYGAQDVYLTGNPQVTFFKVVYRRHTNFSMESILQVWDGGAENYPTSNICTIQRNGDLIHKMWIEFVGGETAAFGDQEELIQQQKPYIENPGTWWIKSVELEIGGQKIDKHSREWLETYYSLTQSNPTGSTLNIATQAFDNSFTLTNYGTLFQLTTGSAGFSLLYDNTVDPSSKNSSQKWIQNNRLYIPLQFWFCQNPGLALPLIALQHHEVKIKLENRFAEMFRAGDISDSHYNLWVDYIFLDTDERRRFSQLSHEYLIEQVQENVVTDLVKGEELNFNHPVKELIWISKDFETGGDLHKSNNKRLYGNYSLRFNGKDRFSPRDISYFTRVQILDHHTGVGGLNSNRLNKSCFNDSIAVYSFALKPEDHQPSGSCNFSRLDHVELSCSESVYPIQYQCSVLKKDGIDRYGTRRAKVFAVNYNVLRIMSGMGGLAYAN